MSRVVRRLVKQVEAVNGPLNALPEGGYHGAYTCPISNLRETNTNLSATVSQVLANTQIGNDAHHSAKHLPARLTADDPARFYLEGFQSLVALPNYDGGEALNTTIHLLPPGKSIDHTMIPMMHWQAGLFGRGTQNLVLRNQISAAHSALDRALQIVGAIQRSLLPDKLPWIDGFSLSAFYQTSARAGGDYYDFFPLDAGRWGLFIGDVSGHGTPAAVLMAITHAIAHARPGEHTPPAALLTYLNAQLTRAYTLDGSLVTAFYAVLDASAHTLKYSRAGHNPPRLLRRDSVLSLDETGALPLGIFEDQSYEEAMITLEPNDLLLLYTDGVTEAAATREGDQPGTIFGTDRLDKLHLGCTASTTDQCIDRIRTAVSTYCGGATPTDDQTLVAIRRN